MSMRIFSALGFALVLAACSGEVSPQPEGQSIQCAIGAGAEMGPNCIGERITSGDGEQFIVHHPDGSFRRFEFLADGSGIGLADGAGELVQDRDGDNLLLSIDDARYVLPIAGSGE